MTTQTLIEQMVGLLSRTENAHGQYEETVLNGVYDQSWPQWYAAYAMAHGMGALLPKEITVEQLQRFLAESFEQFKQDNLGMGWEEYTARQLIESLSREA